MKVTIDTNSLSINEKGEVLRGLVFDQRIMKSKHGDFRATGCYSTFDVNAGFEKIDPRKYPGLYEPFRPRVDYGVDIEVTAYESKDIVAMWWWDGDGDLLIWIKGEKYAYENGDCKCDYTWREVDAHA